MHCNFQKSLLETGDVAQWWIPEPAQHGFLMPRVKNKQLLQLTASSHLEKKKKSQDKTRIKGTRCLMIPKIRSFCFCFVFSIQNFSVQPWMSLELTLQTQTTSNLEFYLPLPFPHPPVLGLKAWDATIQPTLTFFLLCYSLVLLQPERSICLLRISLWPKVCPVQHWLSGIYILYFQRERIHSASTILFMCLASLSWFAHSCICVCLFSAHTLEIFNLIPLPLANFSVSPFVPKACLLV